MLAIVAVGPTIEPAVFHGSQVIRDQVRTELIALIDDGPQDPAFRLEGQPVRIAKATCENAPASARAIDFPNCSAIFLCLDAVLGDVAVGPDAYIKQ